MSGRHSSACIENSCPGGRFEFNVCVMPALCFPFLQDLGEDLPSYDMGRRPWAPLRPAVLTPWRQHRQRQQRQRHGSQVATTTPCTNAILPHKCMVRLAPFQTLVEEFLSALRGPPPWEITNVGTMPVAFWLRAATTWRSEQLAGVIRPESHQLPRLYLRTV